MAVNNGNLHKLPLKSVLNLNRFENEIDDFKTYRKLNSPMYGGVLSNFYRSGVALQDGHIFITYDDKNRLWTKKYNTETTNTDIYCNNKHVQSFSNKTAVLQELEKEYGIIGGTEEYPIYSLDYINKEVNCHFIKSSDANIKDILLVLYYDSIDRVNQSVDIYECENGVKTLVQTVTRTISNDYPNTSFFVKGDINYTNSLLFISILPYEKIQYEDLFSEQNTFCVSLADDTTHSIEKYEVLSNFKITTTGQGVTIPVPTKCQERLGRYPFAAYIPDASDTTPVTYYANGNQYMQNRDSSLSSYWDDATFISMCEMAMQNAFCLGVTDLVFDASKSYVFNGKLYVFSTTTVDNDFENKFGEGQFLIEVDINTVSFSYNSQNVPGITVTKDDIKKVGNELFYVRPLCSETDTDFGPELLYIKNNTNLFALINEVYGESYVSKIFDSYDRVVNALTKPLVDINTGTSVKREYVEVVRMIGNVWNEVKELNISFNLSPATNVFVTNTEYSPVFHGYYYGVYSGRIGVNDGWNDGALFSDSVEVLIGSDSTSDMAFPRCLVSGILENILFINVETDASTITEKLSSGEYTIRTHYGSYYLDGSLEEPPTYRIIENYTSRSVFFGDVAREDSITINNYYLPYGATRYIQRSFEYPYATTGIATSLSNFKIYIGKLGITYTNGELFAITRGIQNLFNQITKIVGTEIDDTSTRIAFINNNGKYCVMESAEPTECIDHYVCDKFIIFKTSGEELNNFNAINTEDVECFPTSLDWNSRNSLAIDIDCGYTFSDSIVCDLYNDCFKGIRKLEETKDKEEVQSFAFVSSINEQYLSANNGQGIYWCSSLVGIQYLNNIPNIYVNGTSTVSSMEKPLGLLGMSDNIFNFDDELDKYSKFFINVYTSDTTDKDITSATSIYYRFSIPSINPDWQDLVGLISYPLETNVLYNISILDELYRSYFFAFFARVGGNIYSLQLNGTTLSPVFAYELGTQSSVNGVFVINGSFYGYTDEYIVPISYSDGVISQGNPIINIKGLQYIESTPYQALFYSPTNRSIYAFTGDNNVSKIVESNRITEIVDTLYNTSSQDIWIATNDGVIVFSVDNTFIKLPLENVNTLFQYDKYILLQYENNEVVMLGYNYDEDFEKVPIELETEFYGVDDFTTSETDCVYIRLAIDDDYNDWVGNVEIYSQVLTQDSKSQDKKVFHIEKSMWDKETNTLLIRYQPKYQQGIGFSLGIKSDFPISAIYINSTPLAITNSKNNI